jgi:RimJ/RimL family protein N-acetyltransferase
MPADPTQHQDREREPFPELVETGRLVLSRWREEDRAAFLAIWADPDVWSAIGPGVTGAPFDAGYAASRFEHHIGHWQRYGFGLWRAQDRASGEIAGWVGPAHPTYVPELADAVEIGWTLRRPFWGRGLASEGAAVALKAGFDYLGVERVVSLINPSNTRSIAVANAAGMTPAQDVRRPDTGEVMRVYERSRLGPAAATPGAGGGSSPLGRRGNQ